MPAISILGLGYVGAVSAACLSQLGHRVFGVDVNQQKVDLINAGKSPVIEQDVEQMIADSVARGTLTATTELAPSVAESDASLICVGTPSRENGSLDLSHVQNVARDLGRAIGDLRDKFPVIAIRSTMLPGTLEDEVKPLIEEASGGKAGQDFGLAVNPEFLREGSAVADFHLPPFTLIGASDGRTSKVLESIYAPIDAPLITTDAKTAEAIKYVSNAFHAVKVTFANEVGRFCKRVGVDSHRVMDIFARDRQLNISEKYLKPGFAFGGSCLPKDVRALMHRARSLDVELPLINSLLPSNDQQIEQCLRMIQRSGKKRIGLLGLSFKSGTDDLRESPLVRLSEILIGKGFDLRIFDRNVALAALVGANKRYINEIIPHISTLLVEECGELLNHAEVLVIGIKDDQTQKIASAADASHEIIDLVRINEIPTSSGAAYHGLCW